MLSSLCSLQECDLDNILLHPRFAVVTVKPDGSEKVRAVDNMSWSAFGGLKGDSVNGHVSPSESVRHDSLDGLAEASLSCLFHSCFFSARVTRL